MKKIVEVDVNLTPEEIAKIIWHMDAAEQIDLLCELMEVDELIKILSQLQEMRYELECRDSDDKTALKNFIKTIYEYLCEE